MTRYFDVCNGDADGLCAVVQWRLQTPQPSSLVTGLKREIDLLAHVQAASGDEVLVCDLSMQRNLPALQRLLAGGVRVRYFDHHAVPAVPTHAAIEAHIDTSADVCTSLIMDRVLGGRQRTWALVGAYGDNLAHVADPLAASSGIDASARDRLRTLGEAINYNAYGDTPSDVRIAPAELYRILIKYRDPLDLIAREPIAAELQQRRSDDLQRARGVPPHWQDARGSVVVLPDASWSRRALGGLANMLALEEPARAHAVLKALAAGGYAVSVRAPQNAPSGAHALAQRFGGAGRARAAGIDVLPAERLDEFVAAFAAMRWGEG